MGLFSSKKKVSVNVTIQKVFEEAQIPDSAKQGIMKAILNQGNVSDYLMEELAGSIGVRANLAKSWAVRNNYYFGLAEGQVKNNIEARAAVIQAIQTNIGETITPVYYTMGPMNSFHYAWSWIYLTHGYKAETNELVGISATEGFPCYLKSMVATYQKETFEFLQETYDMGMLAQLGPQPNSGYTPSNPFTVIGGIGQYKEGPTYEVSSTATEDYVTVIYEFQNAKGEIVNRGLTLSMASVNLEADFHQCRYTTKSGKTGFFTYQQGSGVYPGIDVIYDLGSAKVGTFFPWIYFRAQAMDVRDMDPKAYKDAKKVAEYLGVNYDLLADKVAEDPNVDDVQQSMLMFALAPGESNQACIEYLYTHFSALHQIALSNDKLTEGLEDQFQAFTKSPSQAQIIRDNTFTATFQFSGITSTRKPGSIGKVNTFTSEMIMVDQKDATILINGPKGTSVNPLKSVQPAWVYRKQVNDSTYEEISVFGLRADYEVHRKKGFGAGAGDEALLIPIDQEILRTMNIRKREQVLSRGLQFFVSTAIVTKTPWYASTVFKVVLIIVAIVVTIISFGSAWYSIVAAAAISTTAVVITVLTYIVAALAINYGVKLFVKAVGPKVGIIAAIAAMVVGSYMGNTNAAFGDALVSVGNNLASASQDAYADMVSDIMKEITQFDEYAKGMFDKLSDREEELGLVQQNLPIDPLEIVYLVPSIRYGESPDDLYSRTVHSGNIGASCYDMIEFFVDTKLTLPTLADNQKLEEEDDNGLAV